MFKSIAAAIVASAAFIPAASATPITPEDVAELLLASGSESAEVTWLDETIARIDSQASGYSYTVRMMNCESFGACRSAMIFALFPVPGTAGLEAYKSVNTYNDNYPFGRAFLLEQPDQDEYLVGVDYTLDLSDEHDFNDADMFMFGEILSSFSAHMVPDDEF